MSPVGETGSAAGVRAVSGGANSRAMDSTFRIFFANIQGCGSGEKMATLAGRTDGQDLVVLNEVNKRIGSEAAIKIRCKAKFLTNTPASGHGTGFGTLIGAADFDPENDDFERDDHFEIGKITRRFKSGNKLVVIGCYRSPNMNARDTAKFYLRLSEMVSASAKPDTVVLVGGDDNSHPDGASGSAKRAYQRLEQFRRRLGGIHLINQPTRKSGFQPDHVICFCDMTRYKVTALPPIPGVGDHYEMRIEVDFKAPVIPKQRWFERELVVSEGDFEAVEKDLKARLALFNHETFVRVKKYHQWSQFELDATFADITRRIGEVRNRHRVVVKKMMPTFPAERNTPEQRKLNYTVNKISRTHQSLLKHPNSVKLKEKLHKFMNDCVEVSAVLSKKILEKDISMMRSGNKPNAARLFKEAKRRHKFENDQILLTKSEIDEKINAAEENYLLPDGCPPFTADDFCEIEATNVFKLNPSREKSMKIIQSLSKIDSFYKRHRKSIAGALTHLLEIIDLTHMFPNECKHPKLTFLPKRTIFSLDFYSKFIEKAIRDSWDQLDPVDTYGQFAYKKNRSCELLVAIGLHRAELSDEPCYCLGIDSVKAFDTCCWSTCAKNLQKKFGAGEFFRNYTDGRSYKFNGKKGFVNGKMGRGCPPGTILGPGIFGDFQTTDIEMTLKGTFNAWIWPGLFSDDKQGIAKWTKVLDGSVQGALDATVNWSKSNHVKYHMTGSKKPKCFVFKKNTAVDFDLSAMDELRFDGQPIERDYSHWQLGICHKFFNDDECGNEYGYELEWKSKRSDLSRLAYSFQDVKYIWDPDWIRTCVYSYMVGILQYASALYWLRGSKESRDKARFHYTAAMAACMGMELPELVGFVDCKRQSVPEHRNAFLRACKFLNLPTLKDLAIKNAKNIVRQWAIYEPHMFIANPDKFELGSEFEHGLIFDLVKLANEDMNDWYPCYTYARDKGLTSEEIPCEQWPEYMRFYKRSNEAVSELDAGKVGTRKSSLFTYFYSCKFLFKSVWPNNVKSLHCLANFTLPAKLKNIHIFLYILMASGQHGGSL